jgi:hypothetical protein
MTMDQYRDCNYIVVYQFSVSLYILRHMKNINHRTTTAIAKKYSREITRDARRTKTTTTTTISETKSSKYIKIESYNFYAFIDVM